jgi:ELWxxDGT repeat protein
MRLLAILLLTVSLTNQLFSQAILVKDIDNTNTTTSSLDPYNFVTYKGKIYYSDQDNVHGRELWITDGTPQGTQLFKDISAGIPSSNPTYFIEMDGILYFVSSDGTHGTELWRTDGTLEGTTLVKDINPGGAGSDPNAFHVVNNILYMAAYHEEFGKELWRSDGTTVGTYLVKDINPGIQSSGVYFMAGLDGIVLFNARNVDHGEEVWRSDGTEAGTSIVKDLVPGTKGSRPLYLTVFKDHVYFAIDTAHNGEASRGKQIWRTDGTQAGTEMFLSNEFDGRFNSYHNLMAGKDNLYFQAYDYQASQPKLWKTDGANITLLNESTVAKSPTLVKLVDGNPMFYYYNLPDIADQSKRECHIAIVNDESGELVFDESYNYQLGSGYDDYISDIEEIGTNEFVWQLITQKFPSFETSEEELNNRETHVYLIKTQKSAGSTLIDTFTRTSFALSKLYNGKILFGASADEKPTGSSLYATNGTVAGTSIIKSMTTTTSSSPRQLTVFKNKLFFAAQSSTGLWISDGTESGTSAIEKNFTFSKISNMVAANDYVYFSASTPSTGQELWKTDGTSSGTTLVKDIMPGEDHSFPSGLTVLNNELIFTANDPDAGVSLWKTDGTITSLIKDLTDYNFNIVLLRNTSDNLIYFNFDDGVHGNELWKTDGTTEGTMLVRDIVPGATGSLNFFSVNGIIVNDIYYFVVTIDAKRELWRSDGTEVGTEKVKDFTDELYAYPINFCRYNNDKFLFTNSNLSLWLSDGTTDGTYKVRDFPFDVIDGNASGPEIKSPITLGDKVYFFKGVELWETDGTAEGTKFVSYFVDHSGPDAHIFILESKVVDGYILFAAYSQDDYNYLWSTNGSADGMRKITGVKNIQDLEVMNGVLYISGAGRSGVELWKYVPGTDVVASLNDEISSGVMVYPNPGSDIFNIAVNGTLPLKNIELMDHLGRKVSYKILSKDEKSIQLKIDQENSGLYLFKMQIGDQLVVTKIIKQ